MIWTVEYWYRVYHGGDDAGVYVVDSIHFTEGDACLRRDILEEQEPYKAIHIRKYDASKGSQLFLDFEYPYPD